jgi:hypothetical protein
MLVAKHLMRLSSHLLYLYLSRQRRCEARPCTQVRILPFHSTCCQIDYSSYKESLCFRLGRLCSHLSFPSGNGRALPATLLHSKLWACSDFPLHHFRNRAIIILYNYNTFIWSTQIKLPAPRARHLFAARVFLQVMNNLEHSVDTSLLLLELQIIFP